MLQIEAIESIPQPKFNLGWLVKDTQEDEHWIVTRVIYTFPNDKEKPEGWSYQLTEKYSQVRFLADDSDISNLQVVAKPDLEAYDHKVGEVIGDKYPIRITGLEIYPATWQSILHGRSQIVLNIDRTIPHVGWRSSITSPNTQVLTNALVAEPYTEINLLFDKMVHCS
jgi:hypothetical protein